MADRSWLVAIDLQRVFAEPSSPWCVPGFADVVPVVADLASAYVGRTAYTRFVPPERPAGSWVEYYETWAFALEPASAPLFDLAVDPGDAPVVVAPTMGKWTPDLLRVTGGSLDVVLCGVSTDCCVLSTALAASDAGARVRVVADACAGATRADHQRALDAMALYAPQVTVVSVADLSTPAPRAGGR